MGLLQTLLILLSSWKNAFSKHQLYLRALEQAIVSLCAFKRHTITNHAIFLGRDHAIPSADYKLFSCRKWKADSLFNPLLKSACSILTDNYITIAVDDTKVRKTGKKISGATWMADPMGPPFQTNLIWGLRYLQFAVVIPLYIRGTNTPPRTVPIQFLAAPSLKKPRKQASQEDWLAYKKLSRKKNLSTVFVAEAKRLRMTLDDQGNTHKTLLFAVDGSFCNKTCMNLDIANTKIIARCRRDTKLCFPAPVGSKKIYDAQKFNPEMVRKNDAIPMEIATIFYGGDYREIRYREVRDVLWQNGTKQKRLRCIAVAPMPYTRGKKRHYREPAYLLTTDLEATASYLLQAYFDRWQIEYNHRDEKAILGVGEAQVRNSQSVVRQPALHVAAYSALLLASIMAYGDRPQKAYPEPAWRCIGKRPSCRALVGHLRLELLEAPHKAICMQMTPQIMAAILCKAA